MAYFYTTRFSKKEHIKKDVHYYLFMIPKSTRAKDSVINYPKINSSLSLKRNIEHETPRPHVAH